MLHAATSLCRLLFKDKSHWIFSESLVCCLFQSVLWDWQDLIWAVLISVTYVTIIECWCFTPLVTDYTSYVFCKAAWTFILENLLTQSYWSCISILKLCPDGSWIDFCYLRTTRNMYPDFFQIMSIILYIAVQYVTNIISVLTEASTDECLTMAVVTL